MSVILFYAPFNKRSRDTESLMIAFRRSGHEVLFLSQLEGFQINPVLNQHGISTFTHVIEGKRYGWRYFLKHLFFFVRFCRKHRVEVVYSHLEPANLVAAIGQYFIKARTYLCRHHSTEGQLYGFDKDFYYRLTYRLARRVIVVSQDAKDYMVHTEHIPASKILHIDLAYDFTLYDKPREPVVKEIRARVNAGVLLLAVGRIVKGKRPDVAVRITSALRRQGIDAKLLLLGSGPMEDEIRALIKELGMENYISFTGYVDNAIEYMAAADFLLHPSLMESSCVVVKEAGLVALPVIVCNGVGDFNEYLSYGKNGFLVHKDSFETEAVDIIVRHHGDRQFLGNLGSNLRNTILEKFSISQVIDQYKFLNQP